MQANIETSHGTHTPNATKPSGAERANMNERFIKIAEVKHLTGRSHSSIYADKTFPRSIKLGPREAVWIESEVTAWIQNRIKMAREG